MSKLLPVIGLIGQINTGKDTAAEIFRTLGCIPLSFADPLKICAQELFGFDHRSLWGPSEFRTTEVRSVLQELGTDLARKYRPNIWVDKMNDRISIMQDQGIDYYDLVPEDIIADATGIVISDVRFPNEVEMLAKELKAFTIKITRPDNYINSSEEAVNHESETAQNNMDPEHIIMTIPNEDTLETFQLTIRTVAEEVLNVK